MVGRAALSFRAGVRNDAAAGDAVMQKLFVLVENSPENPYAAQQNAWPGSHVTQNGLSWTKRVAIAVGYPQFPGFHG